MFSVEAALKKKWLGELLPVRISVRENRSVSRADDLQAHNAGFPCGVTDSFSPSR
jgi:hypothetical protein